MRFVHLSDIHIGKRLKEHFMTDDQKYILEKIVGMIVTEKPDGILIAGDVYDKSIPSEDAVDMFDDFLYKLSETGIPVFIISGNHDSAERLAFGRRTFENHGIHISPVYDGNVTPIVMNDEYGEVNIYLLPFIKPSILRSAFSDEVFTIGADEDAADITADDENTDGTDDNATAAGDAADIDETEGSVKKKKALTYNDAVRIAIERLNVDTTKRNIIVTHQSIVNAVRSESEDGFDQIGGVENVDPEIYSAFDYVALGHFHRPQTLGADKRMRYCGTPLKYSLSEMDHKKSVTVVELGKKPSPEEKCEIKITELPLEPLYDMCKIEGSFDELTDPLYYTDKPFREWYLKIVLDDEVEPLNAFGKLRAIYPRLVELDNSNRKSPISSAPLTAASGQSKSPIERIKDFYKLQTNEELGDRELEYITEMLEKVKEEYEKNET